MYHLYCTTYVRRFCLHSCSYGLAMYENVQVRKNLFVIFLKQHEGYHTFNLRSPSCDCIVCRQNNLIFVFSPHFLSSENCKKCSHTKFRNRHRVPSPTIVRWITMFLNTAHTSTTHGYFIALNRCKLSTCEPCINLP